MSALTSSAAWKALVTHHTSIAGAHLRDLFAKDERRFEKLSLQVEDVLVDFSKQRVTEETMKLLLAIDEAEADPVEYVAQLLAQKKKISGFGHRVYVTEDPRATHLRKMSEDLGKAAGKPKWFDMSRKIELYINKEKKLNANVDFYSASTYTTLGIDIDLFTPIFAISRIAGWTAHVIEQHDDNRLIRPRADYIGPPDGQPWVPLADR